MEEFSNRKYVIGAVVVLVASIYIIRLFSLQITDPTFKHSADNNSQRAVIQYPARGLIYDRHGELLVCNQPAYDLKIIPRQLKEFDTCDLCQVLEITKEDLIKRIKKAKRHSYYRPSVLVKQVSAKQYAVLMEKLHNYQGIFVQERTLRKYPRSIAAHILGYVGEVNEKKTEEDSYYKSGDYIGIGGIEKSYEEQLRGKKGVKKFLVDVHNRIQGRFLDGEHDTAAVTGTNIVTTIDADLQEYGEKLMANKLGSIVAIEPGTGEILAMVTSPSYDPNLLVGRLRGINYPILKNDSLKPLFNRATQAGYPPGSIFKMIQAAIGLHEGIITEKGTMSVEPYPNMGDHAPAGIYDIKRAIVKSSNWYFAKLFKRMIHRGVYENRYEDAEHGFDIWRKHVTSFGLGKRFNSDIPNELRGNVPTNAYYDRYYGDKRWKGSTIISNAIGQGELLVIPIQMANVAAVVANKGYYYTPHLIKSISGADTIPSVFTKRNYCTVDRSHFSIIQDALEEVVTMGTGRSAKVENITVCGKTGTAENPHGEDHSVFLAFAPKENPKIAIVVYVENAGYGATWAAPITSLMIEKYLTDSISIEWKEKRIFDYKQY